MDLQYPGCAIFGLTRNEFYFGCFSVFLGGGVEGFMCVHCFLSSLQYVLSFQFFLRRCEFRLSSGYICSVDFAAFSLLGFFCANVMVSSIYCSFDFASKFHALVDCAAVPFSWIDDALMLLYSANVGMNISRNEIEKAKSWKWCQMHDVCEILQRNCRNITWKFVNREMQRIKGTYEHMKKSKKTFVHFARVLLDGDGPKTEARTNGSQKPKAKKQSHKKPRVNDNQNTTKSEKMPLLHSVHTIKKGVSGSTVSSTVAL